MDVLTQAGAQVHEGKFQFDLWNAEPSRRYDWEDMRQKIMENGIRNSLLMAPMPTAGTSQILGNNECIEPFTSNIYVRRVKGGDFIKLNNSLSSWKCSTIVVANLAKSKLLSNFSPAA